METIFYATPTLIKTDDKNSQPSLQDKIAEKGFVEYIKDIQEEKLKERVRARVMAQNPDATAAELEKLIEDAYQKELEKITKQKMEERLEKQIASSTS